MTDQPRRKDKNEPGNGGRYTSHDHSDPEGTLQQVADDHVNTLHDTPIVRIVDGMAETDTDDVVIIDRDALMRTDDPDVLNAAYAEALRFGLTDVVNEIRATAGMFEITLKDHQSLSDDGVTPYAVVWRGMVEDSRGVTVIDFD